MDYCRCYHRNPADAIDVSFNKIEYCLSGAGSGAVPPEPAYEDAANHLISFSLSKIIAALSAYGTPSSSPPGVGSDTVIRASLRRYNADPMLSHLLCYLNVAQRAGHTVYQIDDAAWLAALDAILFHRFQRRLDSILLFEKPMDFIAMRHRILTQFPDSDINKRALEPYKGPQTTWTCQSQFGQVCSINHQSENTALKCCAKQARRRRDSGWWLPHKIECQSLIYGTRYICNCGAHERARARRIT